MSLSHFTKRNQMCCLLLLQRLCINCLDEIKDAIPSHKEYHYPVIQKIVAESVMK